MERTDGMKKFVALMLSSLMLFGSFTTVYAAKSDWMKTYDGLLKAYITGAKGNAVDYEGFALHDLDKDGTPELFLKGLQDKETYQLYRFENYELALEETFTAQGFFIRLDTGDFVIQTSDENSTSYIVYEKGVSLKDSDYIVLREERSRDSVIEGWKWSYYYLGREISEEEYAYTMDQILSPHTLFFNDITELNIDLYVYEGKSFYAVDSSPLLSIKGDNNNSTITFPDGEEVTWKSGGYADIYGLLCVNGTFISGVYPELKSGRTMIPVRAVTETFGATVDWLPESGTVNIKGPEIDIVMFIGNENAVVNGIEVKMDVPAEIINGATYVPIRFLSEYLQMDVFYQEATSELPTVVSLEQQYFYGINSINERDVVGRVQMYVENIDWSVSSSFTASYMNNLINVRNDGLKCGRFISTIIDADGAVRLWTDMYTGQVFTILVSDEGLEIKTGDMIVEYLSELYL